MLRVRIVQSALTVDSCACFIVDRQPIATLTTAVVTLQVRLPNQSICTEMITEAFILTLI